MRAFVTLVLVFTLSQPSFAAHAPISLHRTGNWVVNYDTNSCHLLGTFGTDDQQITIKFVREQPEPSFDLTLIGKPLASAAPEKDVSIGFGTYSKPVKIRAMVGSLTAQSTLPLLILSSLRFDGLKHRGASGAIAPEVAPEVEAATTFITFRVGLGKTYRLETGPMNAPMKALRICTTNLIKSWGYDPLIEASLKRRAYPVGNPGSWMTQDDYPDGPARKGQNGQVAFRLDVDEQGKVTACHVLYRTDPDGFADHTCNLMMKRAHMAPAIDALGKAVRSYFIGKALWRTAG